MKRMIICIVLTVLSVAGVSAQQPDIETYLSLLERGEGAAVQAELPALLKQYPNDSGVQYLQARLTTDGSEAARIYQGIVDNYRTSDWADDALFKVYQFYQAIGLYRTAEIKFNQLKTNYPNSKHISGDASQATTPVVEQRRASTQPVDTPRAEETATRVGVTAPAKVTQAEAPAKEENTLETAKVESAPTGAFAIQVGVFSTPANANKQKMFFEYQKYSVEIAPKMKGSKELFYVFVGRYPTASEAKAKGDEIKRSFNIDYFVVTR